MREVDFFSSAAKRPADERRQILAQGGLTRVPSGDFLAYGFDYFDNPGYGAGYGGYRYDGRYRETAEAICQAFDLQPGSRMLEVGCAKGYLLYEFHRLGLDVTGVDASAYAIEGAKSELKGRILLNSDAHLPFTKESFDFVLAKEVIPHLEEPQSLELITEIVRVVRDKTKIFLELQCAESEEGAILMKAWDVTHQTIKPAAWWRERLAGLGYEGIYHCKPLF